MTEISMSKKKILTQLETELTAWVSKINELKVKIEHVQPEELAGYEASIKDLDVRLDNIRLYQAEINRLPDPDWQNLNDVIRIKGLELDEAIRIALKQFE